MQLSVPRVFQNCRPQFRVAATFVLVLLTTLAGCQVGSGGRADTSTEAGQETVREELRVFAEYFSGRTQEAVENIAAQTSDPQIRRNSILLALRAIPICQRLAGHPDAIVGYFNTWLLCIQLNRMLEGDVGRESFGEFQSIAVEAGRDVQEALEQIGLSHLTPEQLEKARARIVAYADERRGGEGVMMPSRNEDRGGVWAGLSSAAHMPLSIINPFRAIDEGALAVESATRAAERAVDVAAGMPDRLRWQAELLLLNVSASPVVERSLAQIDQLNATVADVERVVAALPASLREESARFLDDLDASQLEIRETVHELRETVAAVDKVVEDVDATLASNEELLRDAARAGEAWEGAVKAFTETLLVLREPSGETETEPAPDEEPGRPFDVLDWALTAERLAESGRELRVLLEEFQSTVAADDLARITSSVDAATASTVDHVALRGAQLVGLIFLCGLAYRVLAHRLAVKRQPTSPQNEIP